MKLHSFQGIFSRLTSRTKTDAGPNHNEDTDLLIIFVILMFGLLGAGFFLCVNFS